MCSERMENDSQHRVREDCGQSQQQVVERLQKGLGNCLEQNAVSRSVTSAEHWGSCIFPPCHEYFVSHFCIDRRKSSAVARVLVDLLALTPQDLFLPFVNTSSVSNDLSNLEQDMLKINSSMFSSLNQEEKKKIGCWLCFEGISLSKIKWCDK